MISAMGTITLLSFTEFEQLPDEPGKVELLDGELRRMPPAKREHVDIVHRLSDEVRPFVETADLSTRIGTLYVEAGYKIGPRAWLQPDVSIAHAGQPGEDYLEGAPVLAVEVISESNTAEEMDRKVKTYLANGGVEVWLVYPKTRCVWVFRQGHAEEFRDVLYSTVIDGLKIDLQRVFSA